MSPTEEMVSTNQANDLSASGGNIHRSPDVRAHEPITLRCFVRQAGGVFVGECIDLDIMVEADTANEAVSALQDAMTGYLEVVTAGSNPNLKGLLPRPSPLSRRLRYHWECLKYELARLTRQSPNPAQSPGPERFYRASMSGNHCLGL